MSNTRNVLFVVSEKAVVRGGGALLAHDAVPDVHGMGPSAYSLSGGQAMVEKGDLLEVVVF